MSIPPDPIWVHGPEDPLFSCPQCGAEMSDREVEDPEFSSERDASEPYLAFCSQECLDVFEDEHPLEPERRSFVYDWTE